MNDSVEMLGALEAHRMRRQGRRAFFQAAVGAAAVGAGFAFASAAQAQTGPTDIDVLNFALNLEYLEANFYYYAVYGQPIPAASTTGTVGTAGTANFAGATAVNFAAGDSYFSASDGAIIGQFAREIANDELNHVNFLRAALGTAAVVQPALDLSVTPNSAFSTAARAATFIADAGKDDKGNALPQTTTFSPYAGVINFLYGAYIFEDVGVTAYKGASPLITSKAYLDAAAGILAAEASHAALIRGAIDSVGSMKGLKGPTIRDDTELVSNARDSLDGTSDLDQGISRTTTGIGITANIVPADSNGLAFSRSPAQTLNIVYLNNKQVSMGGFFPAGVNGNVKSSAAN